MIFWARPHELHIDEMTDICYRILTELESYGEELAPKYLPGRRKKDAKEFDLDKENIKRLLEEDVNEPFPDHARRIGFFSSLKDELTSSVGIGIGNSSPMFNNVLDVSLPDENFSGLDQRRGDLESLFKRLVSIFNPYFAFLENGLNNQLSDKFKKDNKPTYVHWLNYYDKSTAKKIGRKKLEHLDQCEAFSDGYYLKLQDAPIDVNQPEHLELQRQVSEQLGLLG